MISGQSQDDEAAIEAATQRHCRHSVLITTHLSQAPVVTQDGIRLADTPSHRIRDIRHGWYSITLPFSTRRLTTKVLQTGLLIDTESVYTQVTSTHRQTAIYLHPRTIHRADR